MEEFCIPMVRAQFHRPLQEVCLRKFSMEDLLQPSHQYPSLLMSQVFSLLPMEDLHLTKEMELSLRELILRIFSLEELLPVVLSLPLRMRTLEYLLLLSQGICLTMLPSSQYWATLG